MARQRRGRPVPAARFVVSGPIARRDQKSFPISGKPPVKGMA